MVDQIGKQMYDAPIGPKPHPQLDDMIKDAAKRRRRGKRHPKPRPPRIRIRHRGS